MKCKHCQNEFGAQQAIESCLFSWPLRQTVWSICSKCGEGNHIRFEKGFSQQIEPQGSPGYDYEVVFTTIEPTIDVRVDPEYLQIWLNGKHFEVKARA